MLHHHARAPIPLISSRALAIPHGPSHTSHASIVLNHHTRKRSFSRVDKAVPKNPAAIHHSPSSFFRLASSRLRLKSPHPPVTRVTAANIGSAPQVNFMTHIPTEALPGYRPSQRRPRPANRMAAAHQGLGDMQGLKGPTFPLAVPYPLNQALCPVQALPSRASGEFQVHAHGLGI